MSEQTERAEIPAVSISLETSESAETCREVFIEPERGGRPELARSLTLGSRLTSSSSRGSLVRTDNNGYGVGTIFCFDGFDKNLPLLLNCHLL